MEISRVLAELESADPVARHIAEYAERQLDFSSDIGVRTDIAAHAQSLAVEAAHHLNVHPYDPAVDKAIEILVAHGHDHQADLIDIRAAVDPTEERAGQHDDWRRDRREAEALHEHFDGMERDR